MASNPGAKRRSVALPVLIIFTLITVTAVFYSALHDQDGIPECEPGEVPAEAYETIDDIHSGGPFRYPDNDGKHFGNYEGNLPVEDSDFYREYTVSTPGLGHRGERRIVTGGTPREDPEVYYYTADHYESFCEVADVG